MLESLFILQLFLKTYSNTGILLRIFYRYFALQNTSGGCFCFLHLSVKLHQMLRRPRHISVQYSLFMNKLRGFLILSWGAEKVRLPKMAWKVLYHIICLFYKICRLYNWKQTHGSANLQRICCFTLFGYFFYFAAKSFF